MKNIGERVKKYRELMKLTKVELAKQIDCDPSLITKYEKGTRTLSIQNILKIANILKVPVEFFFTDKEYSFTMFARGSIKKHKEEIELVKDLNKICHHLYDLSELLNVNIKYNGPKDKLDEDFSESLVNEIKKELCLPEKFNFETLSSQLFEKWKIIVFEMPFNVDSFSGVSIKYEEIVAIFINKNHSEERKLFSLVHEIAHVVMHLSENISLAILSRNDPKEKEANLFAENFLIPSDVLLNKIIEIKKNSKFTREKIQQLADSFNVSYNCLFYKLHKKELVHYSNKELAPETHTPNQTLFHYSYKDFPQRFIFLLAMGIIKEVVSFAKIAEILLCSIEETEALLNPIIKIIEE
ncbi:MAG: XRE family transcriptional regulator [Endomicrobiaceae bacterium]|jgi:Zn-dependent peptidase ImmA (M78 family)/DNA-binding XRE family transcriptional regulator